MDSYKKALKLTIALIIILAGIKGVGIANNYNKLEATGATPIFSSSQVGSSTSVGDVLQTDGIRSTWVSTSSLGISGSSYAATGTLLDLTGSAFNVKEGTLTNGKICTYVAGTGLVCDYTDVAGSGATTTINGYSGPDFTFSTSSDTNLGLAITGSGSTLTFTPSWIGTLGSSRIASSTYWGDKADYAFGANNFLGTGNFNTSGTISATTTNTTGTSTATNLNVQGVVNWWGSIWTSLATLADSIISELTSADIIGKFTSCSGIQYLGADGACHDDTTGSGGGATTTINNATGPAFSFATTTDTNLGLSILTSGATATYTPTWIGTLASSRIASSSEWTAAYASTTALTPTYIRGLFSETTTGLDYSAGVTSLTSGYMIPTTGASTTWDGKANYSFGANNFLGTGNFVTSGLVNSTSSNHVNATTTNLDITGTFKMMGQYFANLAAFVTYIQTLITENITGLVFSGGQLSLDSGYEITKTASSTNWNGFWDTPSTRITDGAGLTWSGNTLNCDVASGSVAGCLSTANWTTFNGKQDVFTAGDALTLTGTDIDFDGGTAPGGSLGGTWASPTIDDLFLLLAGDSSSGNYVWTGLNDFGGATGLEVVNGAAPVLTTIGQVAVDTTSDQFRFYGTNGTSSLMGIFDKSYYIASTTIDKNSISFSTGTTTHELWNPRVAVTLTNLYCKTDTATTTLQCGDGTNWTEQIVCGPSGKADDGSIVNGTFTAREDFACKVGSKVGTPNKITITPSFKYTLD